MEIQILSNLNNFIGNIIAQESQNAVFWSYAVLFLAMVIEGPIATISGAFLASLNILNIFIIYVLSILGDVVGDVILFSIGYFGGRPILLKAEKFLKVEKSLVEKISQKFEESGEKIVFYVKVSTGLCWITFLAAGTAKMNFKKFLLFSFLGGIFWSGLLVIIGYFFGFAAVKIDAYIQYAGWVIFAITVAVIIALNVVKKKKSEKIISKIK